MPSLGEQIELRPPDRSRSPGAARLLLKCGRDYEEAVDTFQPYDQLKEPQPEVRRSSARLIRSLRQSHPSRRSYIYVNNRLEGNALATIAAILELLQ